MKNDQMLPVDGTVENYRLRIRLEFTETGISFSFISKPLSQSMALSFHTFTV